MTTFVTLEVPDSVYQQAEDIARTENRAVEEVLTETLVRALPVMPLPPNFAEMEIEGQYYEQLHPQLVQEFLGQEIAMKDGKVIDHDQDLEELLERVRSVYPTETILFRKVELHLPRVFRVPSPRLIRNP